jgi:apolipoprotein N-acyltransferase
MSLLRSKFPIPILVVTLALLAGALLAIGYSNDPIWWTTWVAPAPALAAMLMAPQQMRMAVGLLIGLLAGALSLSYRVETGSVIAAVVIAIAYAIAWSSTLKLAATVAVRMNAIMAALILPLSWAAIDTLLIHFSPHGSMGSLAYSQGRMLAVQQLASLGGVPLITFVVLLPGSAAGLAIAYMSGAKSIRLLPQATALAVVTSIAAIVFSIIRLNAAPLPTGPVVVMIAADGNRPARHDWRQFIETYGAALDRAARPGVTVVLPEKILRVDETGLTQARTALSALASERAATIVVGVEVNNGAVITNIALALLPDGTTSNYVKQHLVPGLEADLTPGSRDLLVGSPAPGTGIAICKDMRFPTLARRYASEGARAMLVPAYDFNVDADMMMRVAALRGIEGGFAVARTARDGMSALTDPYGRVIAERRSGAQVGELVGQLPPALSAPPLYVRIGDAFGWICLLAWLATAIGVRQRRIHGSAVTT